MGLGEDRLYILEQGSRFLCMYERCILHSDNLISEVD
jgi:hypothetical protein